MSESSSSHSLPLSEPDVYELMSITRQELIDDIEAKCDTYEEALHTLKKIIKRAIEREKELEQLPKYNDW